MVAVVAAGALCVGTWLIDRGAETDAPPPQPSKAQALRTDGGRAASSIAPLPPSPPISVRIPEIRVDAPVKPLGLLPDGTLDSPPGHDRNLTGWYAAGTQPGAAGTAIVAGHVDTAAGPAVFYGLGSLKKGNTIEVRRADGRTAVFTTDAIEVYDRTEFPSEKVYGASARAELRLITCGGGFSEETGSYLGNVVVFAHLTGVKTWFGGGRSLFRAPGSPVDLRLGFGPEVRLGPEVGVRPEDRIGLRPWLGGRSA
ncbi:class F sortase [Streptomyces syringium]|uniref:class F sortase n=1 Tax=Streptomyces syringium TaxID=76729 RepID=UPI0036466C23